MSAESTSAQGFPTPCTRCGGVLYQHAEFCPYCGADHPLDRAQRKRAGTQLRAVDTQAPHLPAIAPDPSGLPALASPDMPIAPLAVPHAAWQAAGRWMVTKGVVMLLFVAAFCYAAWLLLGDNRRQDTSGDETTNSASTAGGSISPYTPPPAPRATPQSVVQPAAQPVAQMARTAPTATTVNAPVADIMPTRVAPPRPPVVQHYRDLSEALRAANAGLAHNNLAEAKSALADAMSIEPNNADAAQIQGEIGDREKRRDAALNVASNCAKDKLWSCVREHAAHALAIDVSSADAQSLLERVILSTGWKPLASAAAPATAATKVNNADANANVNTNTNGTPALPPLPPAIATKSAVTATSVTANPTATNAATNVTNSNAASAASGVDAEMRAIIDSGWKHSPSANK
ncbi:zinc ribbon domain-containing protein [Paraburkholderia sp. CNPSo 3157]|uniref:Zinc ribbon domain-containing protein n=1 Tax=Paraburkholderia franconis TaxID=2654983 RepID=A0A7X1TIF5_9BURK|nr:zinc ribbon domain-containing protein [Paraburkholderia franconis]MPW20336.1 zinc ribbon domain-containing protein [Paraburkholderia franconis]